MNETSSMILIGIGTAGCNIARGVQRAFGEDIRMLLADTDAKSGEAGGPFQLIGGSRLSGHGAGGDFVAARIAAEDTIDAFDRHLDGVRLAVIATALGGGTGSGATYEVVKHLANLGIPTIVFATLPFAVEGDDCQKKARGIMGMIEEAANATFFLPLDTLVGGTDVMNEAMHRAIDTVASGITLFWRLVEKPGYIKVDAERIRHLFASAGQGRFATVTVQGENRASDAVDKLIRAEMLSVASSPVSGILCGVLAGDDLRLSELQTISNGIRESFGNQLTFELGVVNDEATFGGRLSVVVMLFQYKSTTAGTTVVGNRNRRSKGQLGFGPSGKGRFNNSEPTIWHGEDLDIPTFVRRNITLDS